MTTKDAATQLQGKNIFQCWLDAWKLTFNYKKRTSRYEFWGFICTNILLTILLVVLVSFMPRLTIIPAGYYAVSVLPFISLMVRRLHDINKSGWWFGGFVILMLLFQVIQAVLAYAGYQFIWLEIIMAFVYLIGAISLFIFTLRKGSEGDNNYGAPSLPETKTRKIASFVIAFIFIILPMVSASIIAGYSGYHGAAQRYKAEQTLEEMAYVSTNIMDTYRAAGNYNGLNNETAIAQKIVPEKLVEDNSLINPFGGLYTIAGMGAGFSVTADKLPPQVCGSVAIAFLQSGLFDVEESSCQDCSADGCSLTILKK